MKIRKGNILIGNTKQLRKENVPRTEKEERPPLCIGTSKGGGGGEEWLREFTGQLILTDNKLLQITAEW
jgi:hypothetical protein